MEDFFEKHKEWIQIIVGVLIALLAWRLLDRFLITPIEHKIASRNETETTDET